MNLLSTLWLLVFKVADHESKTILFLQELDHFYQVVSYLSCVIECRKRKEKLLKYQYWRLWETAYFWSNQLTLYCHLPIQQGSISHKYKQKFINFRSTMYTQRIAATICLIAGNIWSDENTTTTPNCSSYNITSAGILSICRCEEQFCLLYIIVDKNV